MLDITNEMRSLTLFETRQEQELQESLGKICNQEEIYWKQRSQMQWLQEGDENTKFFYAVANGRKNRNFIPRIMINDDSLMDPKDIGKIFMEKFKQLFRHKRDFRFKIDFSKRLEKKVSIDRTSLDRPFTLKEIKRAIFLSWWGQSARSR